MSGTHEAEAPHPHVLPLAMYWGVFFALVGLTVATVAVILVDLGPFNIVVAMVIAVIKATLVGAIFMHMWFDHKINVLTLLLSLIFVSVFIIITMLDTEGRDLVDPVKRNFLIRDQQVQKHEAAKPDAKPLRAYKSRWWSEPKPEELTPVKPTGEH